MLSSFLDMLRFRYCFSGLVFFLMPALSSGPALAQSIAFSDSSGPIAKGLVFDILQDSRGFIWFGTEYGLVRYDGYEEKIYQHQPEDLFSLGGNWITCILEDRQGGFWLGTRHNGLQYFDPETEEFQRFPHDPEMNNSPAANHIRALAQDAKGYIWVATLGGGLDRYDPSTNTFHHYIREGSGPLSSRSIHDLHIDQNGRLWVAAYLGLARWKPELQAFSSYDELFLQDSLNHIIECISEDRAGRLLLGMRDGQLFRFSPRKEVFSKIDLAPPRGNQEQGGRIWDVIHRPDGRLWIGRDNGLQVASYQTGNVRTLEWDREPFSLRTLSLFDGPGTLCWLGTGSGVYKVNTAGKKFTTIRASDHSAGTTRYPGITAFSAMNHSRIWVGTTGGLYTYDVRTGRLGRDWMQAGRLPALEHKNIPALCRDSRGNLWISTFENFGENFELWRLHLSTGRLDNFTPRHVAFKSNVTHSIEEDAQGNIWLGNGEGLFRYMYETDRVHHIDPEQNGSVIPPTVAVNKVFLDSREWLWIGANDGTLVYFDGKAGQFKKVSARTGGVAAGRLSRINDLTEDASGNLWIASPSGLHHFDVDKRTFTQFTEQDGLPDDELTSVQWGPSGGLWIGTQNGLARYLPATGTFEVFQEQDGIQGSEFWHRSAFRDHRGYLYFGGGGGLNVFHPDSLRYHLQPPEVYITRFSLFNEPVRAGDDTGLLSKDISYTKTVTLNHAQNVITLGYTALNFYHTEKNRFAYQLEGFDAGWQQVGNKREVTYTNLYPGTYLFRVKASNNDGMWNEEERTLKLIIRPPWWGTWWALLLFFGAGTALLYLFIRLRWQKQLARQESLRLQEIDALKTELYTNITHEFRTPLTLILGPVEKAIRNTSNMTSRELKVIRRNGRRLLNLVNQMLKLRRLETGVMEPDYRHGDVLPVIHYALDAFESAARNQDITLRLENSADSIDMDHDREKLLDILINLLSNALKFTPPGGRITVRVAVKDNSAGSQLTVEVEDSGKGIPPEELPKIFDRFYSPLATGAGRPASPKGEGEYSSSPVGGYREGAGIGLALTRRLVELLAGTIEVESTTGKGSVFRLRLPIRHESSEVVKPFVSEEWFRPENTLPTEPSREPDSTAASPRILIVEDNPEVAHFIAGCLPEGMEPTIAADGQAGLERALADIPDLVISDVMMPEMDGFELTCRLKKDVRTSHIPVILLTARADEQGRLKGLKGGADAYLVKPFNEEELRIRISKLLEGRRRLQAHYLREVGMEWMSAVEESTSQRENAFLEKVGKIVEHSMDDPSFTIEQLSREMGMSHAQLHRKMTALTGQSALKFVRALRLAKARQLLLQTDLNISEIAYQTGFNDPAYFSRVFSNEVGCAPSVFRERH